MKNSEYWFYRPEYIELTVEQQRLVDTYAIEYYNMIINQDPRLMRKTKQDESPLPTTYNLASTDVKLSAIAKLSRDERVFLNLINRAKTTKVTYL